MRGTWSKKCLESHGKRIVDRADSVDPVATGKELGAWVSSLLSVAREEYDLFSELSTLASPSQLATHFGNLLNPIISLLNTTVNSLVTFSKRSLAKYGFLVLSAYEALLELQPAWDQISSLRVSSDMRSSKEANEYKDILQVVRSVCIRMFPETLADIKLSSAGAGRAGDTSTGLLDASIEVLRSLLLLISCVHPSSPLPQAVQFLNNMQQVIIASGDILSLLGDGNWKMGEGVGVVKKKQEAVEVGAQTLLEHYICKPSFSFLSLPHNQLTNFR